MLILNRRIGEAIILDGPAYRIELLSVCRTTARIQVNKRTAPAVIVTIRKGEQFAIDTDIYVSLQRSKRLVAWLGVDAPTSIRIDREENYLRNHQSGLDGNLLFEVGGVL